METVKERRSSLRLRSKAGFSSLLQDMTVAEGTLLFLEVKVTDKKSRVEWFFNQESLKRKKLGILNVGKSRKLYLGNVKVKDSGVYSCNVGDISCSMTLIVQPVGKDVTVKEYPQHDVNEKEFKCSNCRAGFRQPKSFDDHMKTHGQLICIAPGCNMRYHTQQKLDYHMKKKHAQQNQGV